MQGNKEHDPIIGERTGTLTSADRIYPIDDWVGWLAFTNPRPSLPLHWHILSYKRLKCSKGVPRLCPVLEINLGPPYRRKQTSKKPHN